MIAHARQDNKHVGCVSSRVKTNFGVSEISALEPPTLRFLSISVTAKIAQTGGRLGDWTLQAGPIGRSVVNPRHLQMIGGLAEGEIGRVEATIAISFAAAYTPPTLK